MLTYKDLTSNNWNDFSDHILKAEKIFPEKIQSSEVDYINALKEGGNIAKVILSNNQFAGVGICFPFTKEVTDTFEIDDTPPVEKGIYLYSILVNENFQGKGIGNALLKVLIDESRRLGYKIFAGHYRPNGSLKLIKKAGAKEIRPYANWGDSGEEYIYCELSL
jgi:GNAT superfamily N-acetyltransferase